MSYIASVLLSKFNSVFNPRISFTSNMFDCNIDKTSSIRQNTRLYHVKVGKYSYISRNTLIQHAEIGNYCSISEGCNIGMPSHPTEFVSTSPIFFDGRNYLGVNFANIEYEDCPDTHIGHDVWIGAHVQIKSGVKIGNGAVAAAGALVTKDIPPYAIVGGVPAKVIKYRFDEETIEKLQKSQWWDWPEEKLKRVGANILNIKAFLREV